MDLFTASSAPVFEEMHEEPLPKMERPREIEERSIAILPVADSCRLTNAAPHSVPPGWSRSQAGSSELARLYACYA